MNPQDDANSSVDDQIIDSPEASPTQDSTPQASADEESSVQESSQGPANKGTRRPRGKIAQLPKVHRDQLNFMLRDGVPYAEIIAKLGEAGKGIIPRNVSSWHTGPGYQRWQMNQEWLEDMRTDQESGLDLLPDFDTGKFNEAALQVAVTQLFRALRHIGSTPLKEKLGGDPQSFARLVHALARACRETLNLQKHREAAAKAAATELKKLDPNRELSDREHEILVQRMDDFFKKPRRRRPNSEQADPRQPSALGPSPPESPPK